MAGPTHSKSAPFWLKQRHDEFEVVQSATMPTMETEPGQRQHRVSGPFATREAAESRKAEKYNRTLKAMRERNQ